MSLNTNTNDNQSRLSNPVDLALLAPETRPAPGRVFILRDTPAEITRGGIVVPEGSREPLAMALDSGTVVRVGAPRDPEDRQEAGYMLDCPPEGARVLFVPQYQMADINQGRRVVSVTLDALVAEIPHGVQVGWR